MMTVTRAAAFALAVSLSLASAISAGHAEDAFYLGKWKIADAKPAPWVLPSDQLDPSEPKGLIGKTIEIKADSITGPGDFPCAKPQYQVEEGGPEMLYMGSFENMHAQDPSVDMLKLAAQTGFTGDTHFRTVVTGCEYEVDFSWGASNDVARFALNDYIYTITRE
ncbi:MAG TPA: hypothetical protein VMT54_07525 [Candidatus Cybelea sp.]|nr:hypothetical protein [Candidatus Cybelea sp.]